MLTISKFSIFPHTGSISRCISKGELTEYIQLVIVVMVGFGPPALNLTVVMETGSFELTKHSVTVYCMLTTKQP